MSATVAPVEDRIAAPDREEAEQIEKARPAAEAAERALEFAPCGGRRYAVPGRLASALDGEIAGCAGARRRARLEKRDG